MLLSSFSKCLAIIVVNVKTQLNNKNKNLFLLKANNCCIKNKDKQNYNNY